MCLLRLISAGIHCSRLRGLRIEQVTIRFQLCKSGHHILLETYAEFFESASRVRVHHSQIPSSPMETSTNRKDVEQALDSTYPLSSVEISQVQ